MTVTRLQRRNCNKMMYSLDDVLRQQTFKHILLSRLVTQTRHANDAYGHISSSQNLNFSRDRYYSIQASIVRCQQGQLFVKFLDAHSFKSHVLVFMLSAALVAYPVYFLRCHHSGIEVF